MVRAESRSQRSVKRKSCSTQGSPDILLAYPITEKERLRNSQVSQRAPTSAVALDSLEAAQAISNEASAKNVRISVLLELDVGFKRCGIADEDEALNVAQKISDLKNLDFKGLMFYPGHLQASASERAQLRGAVNDLLSRVLEKLEGAGLPVQTVSGGSTPTALESHLFFGVNEIRPGMYIFNDRNMVAVGVAEVEDCALSVITTVVSKSVSGRAIVDAGSKTLSSDRYQLGDGLTFGLIKEDHQADLERLTEEHGHLNISQSSRRYRVGERLTIVPNHVCSTVNMHDKLYGVIGERVETIWEVAGRGKVQ
jgi:D-serine deaminase-like pyridoxal phosphate-dependent protein